MTVSQDSWNLLSGHILVNLLCENLPVVDVNATNILLVGVDLIQKVSWDEDDDNHKEDDEYLELEILLLEELWEGNTDGKTALAVRVSVLKEVVTCFFVCQDRVSFGDLDELIYGLRVVWVLVRVFFSGEFSVSFLYLAWGSISSNTKNFVRYECLEWFDVFDDVKALVANVPEDCKED